MCSIAGIFGRGDKEVVVRMNEAQRHRGPDDQGIAVCEQVALGNTRLAIIDTSADGHQPMHDPETGNWITYNGETYNFKELRRELGGEWESNTDTEVVLRAYNKWGVDAFNRLRGMFAPASVETSNTSIPCCISVRHIGMIAVAGPPERSATDGMTCRTLMRS